MTENTEHLGEVQRLEEGATRGTYERGHRVRDVRISLQQFPQPLRVAGVRCQHQLIAISSADNNNTISRSVRDKSGRRFQSKLMQHWLVYVCVLLAVPASLGNICTDESVWLADAVPIAAFNPDNRTCQELDNIQMIQPYSCGLSIDRWMANLAETCCSGSYDTKCGDYMKNNMCDPPSGFQPQALYTYPSIQSSFTCVELEGINNYGDRTDCESVPYKSISATCCASGISKCHSSTEEPSSDGTHDNGQTSTEGGHDNTEETGSEGTHGSSEEPSTEETHVSYKHLYCKAT